MPLAPPGCSDSLRISDFDENLLPADFLARLVAIIIDLVLLSVVSAALNIFAGYQIFNSFKDGTQFLLDLSLSGFLIFVACPVLLSLLYFTVLHGLGGRTVGKSVMGLRVVKSTGGELGLCLAFIRWIGYQISFAPLLAGFLWAVLDVEKRAWHDILVGSKVVYDKKS